MLVQLKGIGPESAAVLWSEGLFRRFDNRRQVAAYAGLAPTPWQSGSIDHEQGVSKAGNPRLRTTMVELAWLWLQNQPTSALSLWFHKRVERLGGRMRKTIIVALARKLLVVNRRGTGPPIGIQSGPLYGGRDRFVPVANGRAPRASRSAFTSDAAAGAGGTCLPTGASRGGTAFQLRFLKRQLSLPVSMMSQ